MRLSRDWLSDFIDLSGLSDGELAERFTQIGHAVESVEKHGDDTVFDLEITTNRIDAMSHAGMARELAAALGRETRVPAHEPGPPLQPTTDVFVRIDAPEACARYTAQVIRGVTVRPSPARVQRRLEAVGLRPINNVVDATNYAMLALGHPLHAFDLAKVTDKTIVVRRGNAGEAITTLDGEKRTIDPATVVIADARRPLALGGIMGGADSEIGPATRDVLLECAWFEPSVIRRTARRLGLKTDASYRFERRVDPNDTFAAIAMTAALITESAGGAPELPIDVLAAEAEPVRLRLRTSRLHAASGGVAGAGYALDLFRRLGFDARVADDGIDVTVPTYRGDIREEMDLVEEVLRFFGFDNVPASLPRLTTGDVFKNPIVEAEDRARDILVGCGLSEVATYSFIRGDHNALFSNETPVTITNALSENLTAMRLSLLPGLLESVAFNRSYGTRDGALFEAGRTYHRDGNGVRERQRLAIVMFGSAGAHWGDTKRAYDFFDLKGVIEQLAAKMHVALEFSAGDDEWLRKGKRAVARSGERRIAALGVLAPAVLQRFGIKGEVLAAELDLEALLAAAGDWKMAPVARFPGVPMILAFTHGRDLEYERIAAAIRSMDVPYLHEVGLRDRFSPEGEESVKTTLGMWYQAFDRSLTQDEVTQIHGDIASRLATMLPVKLL